MTRPYAKLGAMLGVTLTVCGVVTASLGTWRGWANARHALSSLARNGDPTREGIDARRPILVQSRVRRFFRPVTASILWLAIAMYGLFMVSAGGMIG